MYSIGVVTLDIKNSKILLVVLISLCCFFANISYTEAKTSCSCYYVWSVVGNNETTTGENYYYAQVKYTKSGATVVKSCGYGYNLNNDGSRENSVIPTIESKGKIPNDSHFNIDSKKMIDGDCRKSVCEKSKIYIKPSSADASIPGSLTTDEVTSYAGPSSVVSSSNFNAAIEKNNDRTRNTDNFIDDITGDQVLPSDPTMEKSEKGTVSCDIIPTSVRTFLKDFFLLIQVFGIILLVVMSLIEFVKAIAGSDNDSLRKAIKNTFKRIIITVILLLLPVLIVWTLDMINNNAYETDDNGKRIIGADNNPLCK